MTARHGALFVLYIMTPLLPLAAQPVERTDTPPIWRQAIGGAIMGLPSIQAESVTVVTDGGNLMTYSKRGKFLWNYNAKGRLAPYVTRSPEGTSYICRTTGVFIAVNRAGRELWRIELPAPIVSPVLVGWDGRLFVNTGEAIRCFTASGYPLWSRNLGEAPAAAPVLDRRGGITLALVSGELLEIDAFGASRTRKLTRLPALVQPLEGDAILLLYENGAMEISRLGRENSVLPSLGGGPLQAAGRGSRAAVILRNGKVCLVSADEAQVLWSGDSHFTAAEPGEGVELLYDERGVYALSRSGAVHFSEDGARRWVMRLRGAAALPAFGDEGILYVGGADWILYAYKMEDQERTQPRSLYGPESEGHYGTANPRPSPWAALEFPFDEGIMGPLMVQMKAAITEGRVGADEMDYTAYLMEIAGAGAVHSGAFFRPAVDIRRRLEAVLLLGFIGSRETVAFLADLYLGETESVIKAAAAEAIGRIGVDPDGSALRVFNSVAFSFAYQDDAQVLAATAAAAGALCRFSGPPLSGMGIKLLTALGMDHRPRLVRRVAMREISSLR